ncbi:MAG TPA: amidohydrolase family protein, partial [bacterium]|nr:amidohydrolase family protein [bacterium]
SAAGGEPTAESAPGSSRSSSQGDSPQFIIDAHIHCRSNQEWVDDMVSTYRRHNAMACVLTWRDDMEFMLDAIESYPDVFIGYGRVDLDDPNAVREVTDFQKNGFVGMKFHSPIKNYDNPDYFQIYRLCEEYGMHMLFHTGISSHRITDSPQWGSSSRMRPMYLDTICRQFPNTTVQGAHFGNPWYEEAAEAARWNPTLYFDITGSTLLKLIKLNDLQRLSKILWWASDEAEENPHTLEGGPDAWEHIVFGTDEGPDGLVSNIDRFQQMLDANNVPANIRVKMWGLTMAEVLGIDPETHTFKAS